MSAEEETDRPGRWGGLDRTGQAGGWKDGCVGKQAEMDRGGGKRTGVGLCDWN